LADGWLQVSTWVRWRLSGWFNSKGLISLGTLMANTIGGFLVAHVLVIGL